MIHREIKQEKHSGLSVNGVEPGLQFGDNSTNKPPIPLYFDLFQSAEEHLDRQPLFTKMSALKFANEKTRDERVEKEVRDRIMELFDACKGKKVFLWIYISKEDVANAKLLRALQRVIRVVDCSADLFKMDHAIVFEPLDMALTPIYS